MNETEDTVQDALSNFRNETQKAVAHVTQEILTNLTLPTQIVHHSNVTEEIGGPLHHLHSFHSHELCEAGILITPGPATVTNIVIYFLWLLYCFLGIFIAAETLMCSVEVIMSATR